ncbi:hypothetical protein SNK03_000073 [Fusarium graminearum]
MASASAMVEAFAPTMVPKVTSSDSSYRDTIKAHAALRMEEGENTDVSDLSVLILGIEKEY